MLVNGDPSWQGPPVARGGDGGDNNGMEARLTRLETMLPTLATKEDLARVEGAIRADLHKEIATSTKWFVGWVTTVGIVLVSAVYYIARTVQ